MSFGLDHSAVTMRSSRTPATTTTESTNNRSRARPIDGGRRRPPQQRVRVPARTKTRRQKQGPTQNRVQRAADASVHLGADLATTAVSPAPSAPAATNATSIGRLFLGACAAGTSRRSPTNGQLMRPALPHPTTRAIIETRPPGARNSSGRARNPSRTASTSREPSSSSNGGPLKSRR
jgi:hypothetical protein